MQKKSYFCIVANISDTTRIGLMQYGSRTQLEWHVDAYTQKEQVLKAILELEKMGGGTFT